MRFNFKWIVALGLLLGLADAWWEHSSSKQDRSSADETLTTEPVKARARETTTASTTSAATTAKPVANWQPGVSDVFGSGASTSEQAKSLLAQFPNLPPAGQFETAHHISNLLPDEAYGTWAGYLTNSAISPEARKVIYADLLHRPNSIKLPMLLQLARSPSAPNSTEAAQLLRATLREDHGSDWSTWSLRIQAWLKANPDPARPGSSGMTVGN
ncbi:MAG: hypothetical protein U1F83_19500 [Verrucomicrobiota bacterium]